MSETFQFTRGEWTSASNADADGKCPGRFLAQRGLPEDSGDDADRGTKIHEALRLQNPTGLSVTELDLYESCNSIAERELKRIFGDNYIKTTVWREVRLRVDVPDWPDTKTGLPARLFPHSGQLDAFWMMEGHTQAVVIDFKTGNNEAPESARNEQIRDQIVLLARQPQYPLTDVIGIVVQPLVTHSPEPVQYSPSDISESERRMFERVRASNNPNAPRVAGESQCKFCLAKTKCAAYSTFAGAMIPASDLVPAVATARQKAFQTPMEQWTPEQCALVADILGPCERTLEQYKEFIKSRLLANPAGVPGYELKPGAVQEKVSDAQACFERFLALAKPEGQAEAQKQFMISISVAKGKLKDSLAAVTGLKGKKLQEALDTLLIGITESKQNAASLVKSK